MNVVAVLVVEDDQMTARTLQIRFGKKFPGLEVSFVIDATNAKLAIMGENYFAFDPQKNSYKESPGKIFHAVIWDNQIPENLGEDPKEDVGLKTARALFTSDKVNALVRSHFIVSSSDSEEKFKNEKAFGGDRILQKPLDFGRLGKIFETWMSPENLAGNTRER